MRETVYTMSLSSSSKRPQIATESMNYHESELSFSAASINKPYHSPVEYIHSITDNENYPLSNIQVTFLKLLATPLNPHNHIQSAPIPTAIYPLITITPSSCIYTTAIPPLARDHTLQHTSRNISPLLAAFFYHTTL